MILSVDITDSEHDKLLELANHYGVTVSDIVSVFVSDITRSERCGYVEECDVVDNWLASRLYQF